MPSSPDLSPPLATNAEDPKSRIPPYQAQVLSDEVVVRFEPGAEPIVTTRLRAADESERKPFGLPGEKVFYVPAQQLRDADGIQELLAHYGKQLDARLNPQTLADAPLIATAVDLESFAHAQGQGRALATETVQQLMRLEPANPIIKKYAALPDATDKQLISLIFELTEQHHGRLSHRQLSEAMHHAAGRLKAMTGHDYVEQYHRSCSSFEPAEALHENFHVSPETARKLYHVKTEGDFRYVAVDDQVAAKLKAESMAFLRRQLETASAKLHAVQAATQADNIFAPALSPEAARGALEHALTSPKLHWETTAGRMMRLVLQNPNLKIVVLPRANMMDYVHDFAVPSSQEHSGIVQGWSPEKNVIYVTVDPGRMMNRIGVPTPGEILAEELMHEGFRELYDFGGLPYADLVEPRKQYIENAIDADLANLRGEDPFYRVRLGLETYPLSSYEGEYPAKLLVSQLQRGHAFGSSLPGGNAFLEHVVGPDVAAWETMTEGGKTYRPARLPPLPSRSDIDTIFSSLPKVPESKPGVASLAGSWELEQLGKLPWQAVNPEGTLLRLRFEEIHKTQGLGDTLIDFLREHGAEPVDGHYVISKDKPKQTALFHELNKIEGLTGKAKTSVSAAPPAHAPSFHSRESLAHNRDGDTRDKYGHERGGKPRDWPVSGLEETTPVPEETARRLRQPKPAVRQAPSLPSEKPSPSGPAEPTLLTQTRQKQGMNPPASGFGGAMLGTLGRALFLKGIVSGEAFHDPVGAGMTAGGSAQEGFGLAAAHYAQEAAKYQKLLAAARQANDAKKVAELSIKAAQYSERAAGFAEMAEGMGKVLGPAAGGLEFYTATQVQSPVSKLAHGALGAGFVAEPLLVAAGMGGPLAPVLLVGGAGVALADPWLEAMHAIGASNRELFGAKVRDLYLGHEAGVDASKLKPSMREYAQLSKIQGELNVGDDPEALRQALQAKIDHLKADPRYAEDNLFKPGDAAGLHLRVQEYEGALQELGTGKPGETFTRRWQDEQGKWQEEIRLTYASRYHSAQQLRQKDAERARQLEDYTASLMRTAPGIGAETSRDRIADDILKERSATRKEFTKLAALSASERKAYLEANARFLREAGIPRHSALSGALLTYDNLIEKAAAVGKTLKELGLASEADNARSATRQYEKELLGRLQQEGKITVFDLAAAHDAISLSRIFTATDADRLALTHLLVQKQARGLGTIELFEAPLSEQQLRDLRQDISATRHANGRMAFEQLLEKRRQIPVSLQPLLTVQPTAPRPGREPEQVIALLERSSHPAPLLGSLLLEGNASVLERVAQYYGVSGEKLKEAGIPIYSEQAETQAKVKGVVESAFHAGRLEAREEDTDATPLTGERKQVLVIKGSREELQTFVEAMQTMGIGHQLAGYAEFGNQQVIVAASSLKAWLPPGVSFEVLRPQPSLAKMKVEHAAQARRYERATGTKLERPAKDELLKALLQRLDTDGDGRFTVKDIDINGDGALSKGEAALLQNAYQALKGSLSPEATAALTVINDLAARSGIKLDPSPVSGVTAGAVAAAVEEPKRRR